MLGVQLDLQTEWRATVDLRGEARRSSMPLSHATTGRSAVSHLTVKV